MFGSGHHIQFVQLFIVAGLGRGNVADGLEEVSVLPSPPSFIALDDAA